MQLHFEKQWLDVPAFMRSNSEMNSDILLFMDEEEILRCDPSIIQLVSGKAGAVTQVS